MKHFFVINPCAGRSRDKDCQVLQRQIEQLIAKHRLDGQIHLTTGRRDATDYVREMCGMFPDVSLRFYACGGDGTLNEVVSGAMGFSHAQVTCVPCGTGNDFLCNFPNEQGFRDIEALILGEAIWIDTIRVGDRYALNACNVGFDADVAAGVEKYKTKPLCHGSTAYHISLVSSLIRYPDIDLQITVDGVPLPDEKRLLFVLANGKRYGGSYIAAPYADVQDGFLELCVVRFLPRRRVVSMVRSYQQGKHLDDPKFRRWLFYQRCQRIEVQSKQPISVCIDGESFQTTRLEAQICPKSLCFVVPKS